MSRYQVVKLIVAGCIAITTAAVSLPSFAYDARGGGVVPVLSGPQAVRPVMQRARQEHISGELILKFRSETVVGAVAGDIVRAGQTFRDVTGDGNLDRLNLRYKVKGMHPVFGRALEPAGSMDRNRAEARHRRLHEEFDRTVAANREKRRARKGLKGPSTENKPPFLHFTYRVEVDPTTDIAAACREYGRDPNVEYCQPNYLMEAQWLPNDPYFYTSGSWGQSYDDLWGLKKLDASAAWDVTKGAGVVVAVIDTGVDYNHVDLGANVWTNGGEIPGNGIDDDGNGYIDDVRGWDFINNDKDPMDGHGHGTHVAGTIAAVGDNGAGIIGVAPLAKIMAVKGLSDSGSGTSSALAAAIRYAADNAADVINNSWGCSKACPSNPVAEDAVRYAHDLGSVVVFAAGNNQDDVTFYSPGNQGDVVVTVASASELDTRSYFSNIGSVIDVTAPGGGEDGLSSNRAGRNILSLRAGLTDLYGDGLCLVGDGYYRARGTSMAAPHVAGVAALVVAKHPEFGPDEVAQALRASADDVEAPGFDLLSGTGRVNARKAVAVASVPRVKITGPLAPVEVSKTETVTITGEAYGTKFASYALYAAPVEKVFDQGRYLPTVGAWTALGPESSRSVTGGILASFNRNLLEKNRPYLLKLEVVTTDNERFSDERELLLYEDDPRFYRLTRTVPPLFAGDPVSAGDRFAWIEVTLGANGVTSEVGRVYDGATNRLVTIYPLEQVAGARVEKIHLSGNRIVWYETNDSYGKTVVATLNAAGEIVVERTVPYQLFSADGDTLLLNQGRPAFYGTLTYLYDIKTGALSPEYPLPEGDYSAGWPSLSGTSVVTHMWYPGPPRNYETVNLTHLLTGENEVVKLADYVSPSTGGHKVDMALNGPGVVVWNEVHGETRTATPLMRFDKATKEIATVAADSPGSSFATDGGAIVYSAEGIESGEMNVNLYQYDIPTGATSLFATNHIRGADELGLSFGDRHVQWVRGGVKVNFYDIMVRNDIPALGAVASRSIQIGAPLTLPVTAADPEGDKVDLSAIGGRWPDAAEALPAGATFTDNGDGTGSLQWTPTAAGVYVVSFLARDFSGRKDGTWNAATTAVFSVYDPADPAAFLGVTVYGSGTVHSSPGPDIGCSAGTCRQPYASGTVVTLTASAADGGEFKGWGGACSGTAPCTFAMSESKGAFATFATLYPLDVTVAGSGSVHSSVAPDMNCTAGTCSRPYREDSTVTLTASPASGHFFVGWSGACSGTNSCTVTMTEAKSVAATFRSTTSRTLSVTILGKGSVRSPDAPEIDCTAGTCTYWFEEGSAITLTASPAAISYFGMWGGGLCSGSGNCSLTMNGGKSLMAIFYGCGSMVSSSCYPYIGDALSNAPHGTTIRAHNGYMSESLLLYRDVAVTLEGGYDDTFTIRSGVTGIPKLEILKGTLTVSDIEIQ